MLIRFIIQQPPSIWQNGEDHLEIVDALSHNLRLNASTSEHTSMYSFQTGYLIADISLQFYNLKKNNLPAEWT